MQNGFASMQIGFFFDAASMQHRPKLFCTDAASMHTDFLSMQNRCKILLYQCKMVLHWCCIDAKWIFIDAASITKYFGSMQNGFASMQHQCKGLCIDLHRCKMVFFHAKIVLHRCCIDAASMQKMVCINAASMQSKWWKAEALLIHFLHQGRACSEHAPSR